MRLATPEISSPNQLWSYAFSPTYAHIHTNTHRSPIIDTIFIMHKYNTLNMRLSMRMRNANRSQIGRVRAHPQQFVSVTHHPSRNRHKLRTMDANARPPRARVLEAHERECISSPQMRMRSRPYVWPNARMRVRCSIWF